MKATGIIRRIDDLGRVVIPKDIRRTMRIHDGDPLEIYLEDDSILFKKYSPLSTLWDVGMITARSLKDNIGHKVLICDRDKFIAACGFGNNGSWTNRRISPELDQIIIKRIAFDVDEDNVSICNSTSTQDLALYVKPIVSDDAMMEIYGAIIVVKNKEDEIVTEAIRQSTNVAANILTTMMDCNY